METEEASPRIRQDIPDADDRLSADPRPKRYVECFLFLGMNDQTREDQSSKRALECDC